MKPKHISALTNNDLALYPVWRYWVETNIEYVAPSKLNSLTESSTESYIVLSEFILANVSKWNGFRSPQDFSGIDYIQPVIVSDLGQVQFYSEPSWPVQIGDAKLGLWVPKGRRSFQYLPTQSAARWQ